MRAGSGRVGSRDVPFVETYGETGLREFNAAPQSVQDDFLRQLRQRLDAEREQSADLKATHGVDVPIPHRLLLWDDSWRRRSAAIKRAQLQPEVDWTPDRDADPLIEIPTRTYVEALTGEEVPPTARAICCPLPDHNDRYPSFWIYEFGWNCFACNRGGTIYDLASLLWGIETRGPAFVELHKRLRAVFA